MQFTKGYDMLIVIVDTFGAVEVKVSSHESNI